MTGRQYFYHLEFELYKASEDTASPLMGDRSTFIPTASTDIFSFDLPGSLIICQAQHNSVISAPLSRNCKIGKSTKPNSTPQRPLIDCKSSSASQQRRSSRPNISAVTALRSLDVAKKDWRFGPITVESVLFEADKSMAQPQRTNSGDGKSNVTQARVEPLKLKIKGTKSTELGWGIVHLFREQEEAHGTHDVSSKRSATSDAHSESTDDMEQWDTTILCIPAVPSYMTASDFLGWVGEKTRAMVSHFRMVMTGKMNRYMMLMKFRDGEDARRWKSEWDSKVFNGMEPENCHVLFIRTIVFTTPGSASVARSEFPDISQDAFTPTVLSSAATSVAPRLDAKPLPPPTPALVELPTCPVCLERMDSEVSGLLTILCQHVFHCDCLQKWRGSGCPVCRHVQPSRSETAPFGVSMPSRDLNLCWQCDCSEDLWICLTCGNIGCGRYKGGHAKEHWKDSAHNFALEMETQYVWDYSEDKWVHRLIQAKGDDKLIDVSDHQTQAAANRDIPEDMELVPKDKLENIAMEYTHLLTSQLESQREYFEEQVARIADRASSSTRAAEESRAAAEAAVSKLQELTLEHKKLRDEIIPQLERDRDRAVAKAEKSQELARKMTQAFQEEKQVSKGLMDRIKHLDTAMDKMKRDVAALKQENVDLKDQNRDLSFFISSQDKLKNVDEELQEELREGTMSVPDPPEVEGKGKKKKGKGRA